MLLRALRDKDWYVQRNAAWLLNLRLGDGAPEPGAFLSSAEEAEAAIRTYHDWWKGIQEMPGDQRIAEVDRQPGEPVPRRRRRSRRRRRPAA